MILWEEPFLKESKNERPVVVENISITSESDLLPVFSAVVKHK